MKSYLLSFALATQLVITPVAAQGFDFKEFMSSVACHSLPMGSCDMLDADNARAIALTYRSLLTTRFCGTPNFVQARQLLELGDATSPNECKMLLAMIDGSGGAPTKKSNGCAANQIKVLPSNHCVTKARFDNWVSCQLNCSKKITTCPGANSRYLSGSDTKGNFEVFSRECSDEFNKQIQTCQLTNCGRL